MDGGCDRKVQNMDLGPWTDPLFLLALKLAVIKDYECVLRLWYNLNSCLLLKSLSLRTAGNLQTKSFPLSETWTLVKTHSNWVPQTDNDFFLLFIFKFFYCIINIFKRPPCFIVSKLRSHDTLRDSSSIGKPCTSFIAHLPSKFMLKQTGWFSEV